MIEFYCKMMAVMTAERDDEKGATAVEYGLLVALIAAVIITAVVALQGSITGAFESISNKF